MRHSPDAAPVSPLRWAVYHGMAGPTQYAEDPYV